MTFPSTMSPLPLSNDFTLTANSGALVPKATMVRPIRILDTLKFSAIPLAPSTKKSAPFISTTKPIINKILPIIIQSISDEYYENLQKETDNEVINYFYLMDDDDYDEEEDLDCEYQYNPYEQLDIDTINSILLNQAICNNRNIETFDLLLFDRYIINNLFSMVIKKVEKINNQTSNKFRKEYINLQYKLIYINPTIENDIIKNNFDFNKINSYDPYNKENYILLEVKYDDIKKYIDKLYEILISTAVSKLISTSDESKNLNDSFNYEVLTIVTDELLNKINYKKLIIFENKIVKAFNGAKNNQQYLKSVNNALSLIKKRTNKVKIVSKN